MTFAQTLLDSCLGSRFQRKNVCSVCGCVTEDSVHCGKETSYLRGLKWVDNNMVNLISSCAVTLLSALLFVVIM